MIGKLQVETISSQVLKGNPLGDPHLREVPVYLPPSYGRKGSRLPVLYYLCGFTGTGRGTMNVGAWKENIFQRLDRLIASGKARECALVAPDCFTAYGGSQYLDSTATGRYETHVVSEVVPYLEDKLGFGGSPASRGIMGKSSGGFGALTLGMRHPKLFGHVACHSGDMLFEPSYGADIGKSIAALAKHGGSFKRFAREFLASGRKDLFPHDGVTLIAMAACYSPNPASPLGFDMPFDEETGELIPKIWARWKNWDPVTAAPRHRAALKGLKTLYFDCGIRDEFFLFLGARKLSRVLKALKVAHRYEEHGLGHMDMAERYDVSLEFMTNRMKEGA